MQNSPRSFHDQQQSIDDASRIASNNAQYYSGPYNQKYPTSPYQQEPTQASYALGTFQQYQRPYFNGLHQQSAPSSFGAVSSQSSQSDIEIASTVTSYPSGYVTSPTYTNAFNSPPGFQQPYVNYSTNHPIQAQEILDPSTPATTTSSITGDADFERYEVENANTNVTTEDGSDLATSVSVSDQSNFMKQDPSISVFQNQDPVGPFKQLISLQQQLGRGSSLSSTQQKPSIQYHPVVEATSFSKRGPPSSEMAELTLPVMEYAIQMLPEKLTMLASKCHPDECGFVLVFEVQSIGALAITYFQTKNLGVCDIVFTNAMSIIKVSPLHFSGNFICMLRRSKTVMSQKLKNVVIDDILCCRPWFENKFIEFNTINPIISDVSIVCGGRKAICVGQTASVNFSINACNPSPLYFHPEAKGLHFSPEMVIIPSMSCVSLPVKITPLEGCSLRPHIRLCLCDLNENEERIGLSLPFIVYPQIKSIRTIRGHEVIYVDDDKTCLRVIEELNMIACGFVFLDTEWKPMSSKQHNKIALIQLCADKKCYLLHIHKFRDRIPRQLFNFLSSQKIIKIGLAISYDAKKFHDDYRQPIQPILDLRDFTWFQDRDKKSLNFLVQNILKEPNRTKKCTMSNWENDLDDLQIEYAALDVIFMSEIFEKLFGGDINMQAYAILMFNKRQPSLTKNIIPQHTPPQKREPAQNGDSQTGSIVLVDANGNIQYKLTKKHAKRLLMLQQARKVSENMLQLMQ